MRLTISYIGDSIIESVPGENVLYFSHNELAKKKPNHFFVKKAHRPEKTFLLISQQLTLFLLKNQNIDALYFKDHYEISYYVLFYKKVLKIKSITFEKTDFSFFDQSFFLSKKILEEARAYINKHLEDKITDDRFSREFTPSIIMTTFNRALPLEESLRALHNQSDKNFELIVVNDGSTSPEALATHEKLKRELFSINKKWKWIDQQNTYLGQARNNGASLASGNCFIFLDDDNIPMLNMVEMYKYHWETFNFEIFTSCFKIFKEDDPSIDNTWAPFPTPLFTHTLINIFSDAQCLISRNAFYQLGQYTTERKIGYEDWEFFLKSYLKQIPIFPIIYSLYSYRIHKTDSSMRSTTNDYLNVQRGLRPLTTLYPRLKNAFLINAAIHSIQVNKK